MQARAGATGGDKKWLDLAQALTVRPPRRFANKQDVLGNRKKTFENCSWKNEFALHRVGEGCRKGNPGSARRPGLESATASSCDLAPWPD